MRAEAAEDLSVLADIMKANPTLKVCVNGHVNFCKTSEAALKLSEVRWGGGSCGWLLLSLLVLSRARLTVAVFAPFRIARRRVCASWFSWALRKVD